MTRPSIPFWFAILLCWSAFVAPADPPFGGTIFIDPDIMTDDDPSTLTVVVYDGQGMRTMYDRRADDDSRISRYGFNHDHLDPRGLDAARGHVAVDVGILLLGLGPFLSSGCARCSSC